MIKIYRSKNKQFYFTIQALNGQVLATSETYINKTGLKRGIRSVVKNCYKFSMNVKRWDSMMEEIKTL